MTKSHVLIMGHYQLCRLNTDKKYKIDVKSRRFSGGNGASLPEAFYARRFSTHPPQAERWPERGRVGFKIDHIPYSGWWVG